MDLYLLPLPGSRVVGLESWTWTQVGLESDFLRTWTGLGLEGQGLGLGLGLGLER